LLHAYSRTITAARAQTKTLLSIFNELA